MNKCKFASLIMLSAFMAGIASSSAVSAQGEKSLVKIVNEDSKSYGDSVDKNSKVSGELAVVTGKSDTNIEVATDEETRDIRANDSTDAK